MSDTKNTTKNDTKQEKPLGATVAAAPTSTPTKAPSLISLLSPYKWLIAAIVVMSLLTNAGNLVVPRIIASAIDAYTSNGLVLSTVAIELVIITIFIFLFAYLQSIAQTYAAEQVARDIRNRFMAKISHQTYAYIQRMTSSRLLTNLTSDMDNVKLFVSQAIVNIVSSIFLIIGSSILLIMIDWQLALAVLLILPLIGIIFWFVFSKMRPLFTKRQQIIDSLNKVINESILGSSLIRVLNSQQPEYQKFFSSNTNAKDIGLQTMRLFASLIPLITLIANLAILTIVALGGRFVILGSMSLGNFTAFTAYLGILIFPILIIGFMSNVIAQASASYARVHEVLNATDTPEKGTVTARLRGDVEARDLKLSLDGRAVLKDISFSMRGGTKNAIIGPTAAGKTQVLYLLTGLIHPDGGEVLYDGKKIEDYDKEALHEQVGFVFQDSVIFNLSLRENVAFGGGAANATAGVINKISDADVQKAIQTAELDDFIAGLPQGLDTVVSERGTSLSGGQKQRIMLARALALNPRVLLLDDFTARVDAQTEQKIVANIQKNYPGITLIAVTQKIAPIENYDQILLVMEGELLAKGTHAELMKTSPEYVQIFDSQKSTSEYEEPKDEPESKDVVEVVDEPKAAAKKA